METTATAPLKYGWSTPCLNVNELLKNVTEEINSFEVKQLGKLKGELEAFDKKKQAVSDAYGQKYPVLLDRWCRLTADMEILHRTLVCLFGTDAWKSYITLCICPILSEIADADAALQLRLSCALGPLERARNEAIAETEQEKVYLDTLTGNQAALEKDLTANEKWIADIKTLIQGPDAAKAIHLFWFKVLPKQWGMASDALRKKLDFAVGQLPGDLCPPKKPAATQGSTADSGAQSPHPVPWLVDPKEYPNEIDCAWSAYWEAKKTQGKAEVDFNKNPDDVATAAKKLGDLNKTLDARIGDCLKDSAPAKDYGCAAPTVATTPAAQQTNVRPAKGQPLTEPPTPQHPATVQASDAEVPPPTQQEE